MIRSISSPCWQNGEDCKDRSIDLETNERCHTTCKEYIEYTEKLADVRANRREASKVNIGAVESVERATRTRARRN